MSKRTGSEEKIGSADPTTSGALDMELVSICTGIFQTFFCPRRGHWLTLCNGSFFRSKFFRARKNYNLQVENRFCIKPSRFLCGAACI